MRKFVLLLALVSVMALAWYTPLGAGVKSAPIVVSSVPGNSIYVIVTPDDGNIAMYDVNDINPLSVPKWTSPVNNTNGIPSTGGHIEGTIGSTVHNILMVAPKSEGLIGIDFGATSAAESSVDTGYWNNLTGGIAVFEASETDSATMYIGVVGVSEDGNIIADIIDFNGDFTVAASKAEALNERAYSSVAVDNVTEGSVGSAMIYLGTDENFYVYALNWDIDSGVATLTQLKKLSISGKAQSGIALDDSNAYFLTYGLDSVWFNVYPKGGNAVLSYKVPLESGYSPDGYPTNSPVVVNYGTGKQIFFGIGKAVYYYDTNTYKLDKYADIGEPIYVAPVVLSDKNNPENSILVVVTANGDVYKVDYQSKTLISSECNQGDGYVYAPPAARGGKLLFAVSTFDGKGKLCAIDISDLSAGASSGSPWPAFGYTDGRTQTAGYNPPFKIPIFLKAYMQDGSSINGIGVEATYTTDDTNVGTITFDGIVNVPHNGDATVVALDYATDLYSLVDGTDASYVFTKWLDNDSTSRSRNVNDLETSQIWKASYTLSYLIQHEIRNYIDDSLISSDTIWATALENYTLNAAATYVLVRWEIYTPDSATPIVSTNTSLTLNVKSPILVKEYVKRVYGHVQFKYPKYIMEPIAPANRFMAVVKVTDLSTANAGDDATEIKAFDLKIDLSSLPFDVSLVYSTYEVNLEYPTNVSATTTKLLIDRINDGNVVEYILALSTPVEQATDIFMATLTFQYSGEGFPYDSDSVFTDSMINMKVGDKDVNQGVAKPMLSSNYPKLVGYLPEFLGYTSLLGDFDDNGCVDIFDFMALTNHYGLTPSDPDWNPIYDIGPREDYDLPSTPGYLVPQNPRTVDFTDLLIESLMYGTCK